MKEGKDDRDVTRKTKVGASKTKVGSSKSKVRVSKEKVVASRTKEEEKVNQ